MALNTRSSIRCPFFGDPRSLPQNQLPTYADVMRSCAHERLRLRLEEKPKIAFSEIAHTVATNITDLYAKASIPTITHKSVFDRIMTYRKKYENLMKSYQDKRASKLEGCQENFRKFIQEADNLFDVSACKCQLIDECSCEKSRKVPFIERPFLIDQRTRQMYIGNVDIKMTEVLSKRQERKYHTNDLLNIRDSAAGPSTSVSSYSTPRTTVCSNNNDYSDSDSDNLNDDDEQEYTQPRSAQLTKTSQIRIQLPNTAAVSFRYGVSLRAAAALSSAVLTDVGIISSENTSYLIDKSKLNRQRAKIASELKASASDLTNLEGLYFDGRKDNTICKVKEGAKFYKRTQTEEHISLIREPGGHYFGHISPPSGTAVDILNTMLKYLKENGISTNNLKAVGCDGTVVNTGNNGGVIHLLERKLNRPLQWNICLLHFNELPLRHLVQAIDGQTSGPKSYSGFLGRQLETCESLPVKKFKRIAVNLPSLDAKQLSKDSAVFV